MFVQIYDGVLFRDIPFSQLSFFIYVSLGEALGGFQTRNACIYGCVYYLKRYKHFRGYSLSNDSFFHIFDSFCSLGQLANHSLEGVDDSRYQSEYSNKQGDQLTTSCHSHTWKVNMIDLQGLFGKGYRNNS